MKRLLSTLALLVLLTGAFFVYDWVDNRSPIGKCFKFKEPKEDTFLMSLVLKIKAQEKDETFTFELVKHGDPQTVEEMLLVMFLNQNAHLKSDAFSADGLERTDCPKEN